MKFLILVVLALAMVAAPVRAISSTPSGTATAAAKVDQKAQDLLNRVANKVAELSNKQRRIYEGTVKSVGTNSYLVTTDEGERTITTNDVTGFYRIRAGNRTEINFKGLKAGDDLAAIGTIDPNTSEMTAKQIIAKIRRHSIVGAITTLDKNNIATITSPDEKTTKVDLSDAISLKKIDSKGKIASAKAADFTEGSIVFVIAYINDGNDTMSVLKAMVLTKS